MDINTDSFIIQCKANYFLGIRPANKQSKETEGYKRLVEIAKAYFDSNRYDDFAGGFMEGQYLISLWAAHLMLEYGQPNEELKQLCLTTIKDYTENSLATDVAEEEKVWLDNYCKSY